MVVSQFRTNNPWTRDAKNAKYSELGFIWFIYPEAGSYKKIINVDGPENSHGAYVVAPVVEKKETAHFILKVTDKGTPPIARYKRVIVTIIPNGN